MQNLGEKIPITEQQQRMAAFTNLFASLKNPESGSYGFISLKEHEYLKQFYEELKLLTSKTFCARNDDAPLPHIR
ncbi:MAG: hypothetical protein IPM82_11970 [Saprospiraceae bacterium]|nr:hypothetical protein [Saprospiraceae bacterium]